MLLVGLAGIVACSAATQVAQPPPGPSAVPTASASSVEVVDAGGGAEAAADAAVGDGSGGSDDAGAKGPEGPSACPGEMKLVEGEYCSEVEHKCLRSWFDKSNRKVVCEQFEPTATCVGTRTRKRFCIDTYEWPNIKGERPEVMNIFYQAQVKCAAVGKRMCTESEWTMACEGPQMKPFPYGYARDATKCNGDHPWDGPNMRRVAKRDAQELGRLWRGVRSGSQPDCISDYGVADLPANTDEVVASEHFGGDWQGKFDSVHTGGPWYKGVRNQCRPKIYTHDEGFYYYFLSFRCCAEPDGATTDPRTPKQVKANWAFSRVERLARFTTEQMRQKLELKRQGQCTCGARDTLCKTMCGTLLGPNAVDADPLAPRP